MPGRRRGCGPRGQSDPCRARQLRQPHTERSAMLVVSATARPVQWVTSPGGSEQVRANTCATVLEGSGCLPGGRVLSCSSPSTPSSPYRSYQRQTAGRLKPTCRTISCTVRHSPDSSTIWDAECVCVVESSRWRGPSAAPWRPYQGERKQCKPSALTRTSLRANEFSVRVNALRHG